jgi:hypothetical protein
MEKIVYTGCSFTWGQGLELAYPPNYGKDWVDRSRNWPLLSEEQKEFIRQNRWTKLLSDKMGMEEVNVSRPGHSNGESLIKLKHWIDENGLDGVKYIIFQITHEFRDFSFIEEQNEPLTGMELAELIEKKLMEGDGWNDLNRMQEIMHKLRNNFDLMEDRHLAFLTKVTDWFYKIEKEHPNCKCYFINWVNESKINNYDYPHTLPLFDKKKNVLLWSKEKGYHGEDWMKKQGFEVLFGENHLSIDAMPIFADIIYDELTKNT